MNVLVITSPNERCGIREYSNTLKEAMGPLDVQFWERNEPPEWIMREVQDNQLKAPGAVGRWDLAWLNHHAALHAAWKPEHVRYIQESGIPVVVTQHDTFETSQIMQDRGFECWISADAWVTHELVQGLRYCTPGNPDTARYRTYFVPQGVPAAPPATQLFGKPTLGLFGFDFPWKNFDLALRTAGEAGWGVRLLAPGASDERVAAWMEALPGVSIERRYLPTAEVVRELASCWATAFLYTCGNSGTSGAIRLGLAARRPVVAFKCRQFRDLYDRLGVWWADDEEALLDFLEMIRDPAIQEVQVKLVSQTAEEMSWARVAQRYKEIYERVLAGPR